MQKKSFKEELRALNPVNFVALLAAGIINSIGVTIFMAPVHLYDSGFSGTAMLLWQLTPEYLSLSLFLLVLNIPFFIYGYRRQGAVFTVYSLFAVTVYSLSSYLITYVLPIDVSSASPDCGNRFIAVRRIRRTDLRCGKRTDHPFWRSHRRCRGYGSHLCKALGAYSGAVCDEFTTWCFTWQSDVFYTVLSCALFR